MAFQDSKHKGVISNYTGNGIHCLGAFEYFQIAQGNQTIDIATRVGIYSSNDSGSNLTEIVLSPSNISISAPEATLSNVTVWSANSILTQGRGDARYQPVGNYLPAANFTYANIGGTIPTATNTTLGAVKVGQTLEISNGVLNVTDLTLFGGTATASGPDVYFGGGA